MPLRPLVFPFAATVALVGASHVAHPQRAKRAAPPPRLAPGQQCVETFCDVPGPCNALVPPRVLDGGPRPSANADPRGTYLARCTILTDAGVTGCERVKVVDGANASTILEWVSSFAVAPPWDCRRTADGGWEPDHPFAVSHVFPVRIAPVADGGTQRP